jgi:hypothetical protein
MRPYRVNSSNDLDVPSPPRRRGRAAAIVVASVAAHAALLAVAFAARAPEPTAPKTEVVRVLAGHVDPMTGAFEANGLADARIAKK